MAECTQNYDNGSRRQAHVRSVRAAVRTADTSNISVFCRVCQPRCNIALLPWGRNSLEHVRRMGRTRQADHWVAVVVPGDFVILVADASHARVFVFAALNQRVLRFRCNCTKHACSHHTIIFSVQRHPRAVYAVIVCLSVCLSVCLLHLSIASKRLNAWLRK